MFKNKGDRLESLTQYVYQVLSDFSDKKIDVKNKYNIIGKSGVTHNIDVYYQFEQNGIIHKVIFECKNWNYKVSKEKILTLKSIIDDIPNSIGVIVSPKGYQSGAEKFAKHNGIVLISGSKQALLSMVAQRRLQVLLPDEMVIGEPFYCLMEKGDDGQPTGTYITYNIKGKLFLILFFSKKEAEQMKIESNCIVRGIDKNHLRILCFYSKEIGLKLAIKQFASTQILDVDTKFINDFFL